MTDSNYQNRIDSDQQYSPIINYCDYPSNNITPEPQIIQTNITPEENNLNKNSGEYIIYKTSYCFRQVACFLFFSFCLILSIILFISLFDFSSSTNNTNDGSIMILLIPIIGFLLGCCEDSSYNIIYDSIQKKIILRKVKIFKCIKTNQIIQINDIQRVIFEKYGDHELCCSYFKAQFILANETSITAIDISDNKDREYAKVFQSLKNVLPEEIYFEEL